MESQEVEKNQEEVIQEIKNIPNLEFYDQYGIYQIRRVIENKDTKMALEIEAEEDENTIFLWINYISIKIINKNVKISITEYDDSNHYVSISINGKKWQKNVESESGEPFYFLGFYDVYDTFSPMKEFIKERIVDIVSYHENEIDKELKNEIQNLLTQI